MKEKKLVPVRDSKGNLVGSVTDFDSENKISVMGVMESKTSTITFSLNWISVKDRLPEQMDLKNLLCDIDGNVFQGYYSQFGEWHSVRHMGKTKYEITHWMPLPEPPKAL